MRNVLLAAVSSLALASAAARAATYPDIFVGDSVLDITLAAPLGELFARAEGDADYQVAARLSWHDELAGRDVTLDSVRVSERGHTSRHASECTFPKLKIDMASVARDGTLLENTDALKVGTHCGDRPDSELTPKYGRLANEDAPQREALVYRLLRTVGVPTLLARPARITYVFTDDPTREPLTRLAMLLENDQDARERLGATGDIEEAAFGSAREQFLPQDTARVAFAEAMIGNFDWCLRMFQGDIYRCDERHPLWNVLALTRPDGRALPLIYDFDLSGPVVGRHVWFKQVFDAEFVRPPSSIAVEVTAQVQRTRSLFDRALLDETRAHFLRGRTDVMREIERSPVDAQGRELARQYIDAFYEAIETDARFYGPVIVDGAHEAFLDPDGTRPACGASSVLPVGTPVSPPLEVRGAKTRVRVLDALWQWTGDNRCDAVHMQPVWVSSEAIGTDYQR